MGFEKLIDLIVQFLDFFKFCTIIDCYQKAVLLHKGSFRRVLGPGLHFYIPFCIQHTITERVVPSTRELCTQTLITSDAKPVAVGVVILFSIFDIEKATLEVNEVREAVDDACQATLAEAVLRTTYDELRAPEFWNKLEIDCRRKAKRFGITIETVRPHELAPTRTYRLIGSK